MKKLLCLVLFHFKSSAHTQTLPDSVLTKYRSGQTSLEKGECLYEYFNKTMDSGQLVEKNKTIRLAEAKKTIEKMVQK